MQGLQASHLRTSTFLPPSSFLSHKPQVKPQGKTTERSSCSAPIRSSLGGRPPSFPPAPGGGGFSSGPSAGSGLYLPFLKPALEQAPVGGADELSLDEKLEILRDRRGLWHEYAALIPSLVRSGLTPQIISELTGMTGVEQNTAVVAAQVHTTLIEFGLDPLVLSFFDVGGEDKLYELRILSGAQRKEAAAYVAAEGLDGKGAREVAKAMKEHERRKRDEGREYFSTSPGDCLAFALYRQANETRSAAERQSILNKARATAETDAAREKIERTLGGTKDSLSAADEEAQLKAAILTVRLRYDETHSRPVPVLGDFEDSAAGALDSAPSPQISGPFRVFSPTGGRSWAAIPGWGTVLESQFPVAFLCSDLSLIPSLRGRKVEGPALIVLDKAGFNVERTLFYVGANEESGRLEFVSGKAALEGRRVLAKVLLVLLPPDLEKEKEDEVEDWE